MDQRRFTSFIIIAMLIFIGWSMMARTLFPPPPEPPDDVAEVDGQPAVEVVDDKPNPPGETATDAAEADPLATDEVGPQWFTLGSMKPGDPYQMAITINNRGAAVENVELVGRDAKGRFRYRDLDDDSGYLGYLTLAKAPGGGCTVESLIAGSPADLAGIKPGDVLLSIEGTKLDEPRSLAQWLIDHSDPGDTVTVELSREGQAVTAAAVLTRRPLSVVSPEFQKLPSGSIVEHQHGFLMDLMRLGTGSPSGAAPAGGGIGAGKAAASLRDRHWSGKKISDGAAEGVELSITVPLNGEGANGSQLEVIRRYWLRPPVAGTDAAAAATPGYDFSMEIEFRNVGDQPMHLAYQLDGPTGLPKEGWWYAVKIHPRHFMTYLGARDVIWSSPTTGIEYIGNRSLVKEAEKNANGQLVVFAPQQPQPFNFVGVDAQYFSCLLLPEQAEGSAPVLLKNAYGIAVSDVAASRDDNGRYKNSNVTYRLESGVLALEPNGSLTQRFTIFAGPKDPEVLEPYGLGGVISYGWFGFVSKPLLKVLHGLYWLTGSFSYGLAIVLLTLLVRLCLLPLGLKAARSAKRMQELAPEIKKIKERYPDELEKQWRAQQELLKKHNVSHFGGCLPMLLQLPIFLGLYRGLATDIQLRQAPLVPGMDWCSNLSGPDKLFYWEPYLWESIGGEYGWLGPYFNLLPLITVALFYVHQKLFTPPATDEQQKQMQKTMSVVMLLFGFMFFKVPAGLCIYFITSSLWGLGERLLLKKEKAAGDLSDKVVPAAEAKVAKVRMEKVERRKELARKRQKRR